MGQQGKYRTKSVRLTEDEASVLAALAQAEAASEAALLRQWVLCGMRRLRIEQAAAAYQRDEVDLRDAASRAGIPIGLFVDELAERRIAMLDDPEVFEREIESLRAAFGRGDDLPPEPALSISARPARKPSSRRTPAPTR